MSGKSRARTTVVAVPAPDVQAVHEGRAVTLIEFTREGAIGATYRDGRLAVGCREQSYIRSFRR